METPHVFDNKPKSVTLMPGVYYFCRCGKSKDGKFCDGAHKGTDFVPKKFTVDEPTSVYLCMCKNTENAPYCDGAHRKLPQKES